MKNINKKIKISGFGGQGVLFLGKFIAELANIKELYITWLPSYGPEMRGGTANCSVVISSKPIPSPVINDVDILIAFNQPSYDKFKKQVLKNGLIIIDSSLVKTSNKSVIKVEATKTAERLGNKKVANMVMAGVILKELDLFYIKSIKEILKKSGFKKEMIDLNLKALESIK